MGSSVTREQPGALLAHFFDYPPLLRGKSLVEGVGEVGRGTAFLVWPQRTSAAKGRVGEEQEKRAVVGVGQSLQTVMQRAGMRCSLNRDWVMRMTMIGATPGARDGVWSRCGDVCGRVEEN